METAKYMIHPRYSDTPHHDLLDFKVGEDSTGSVGMLGLFHTGGRENPKKKLFLVGSRPTSPAKRLMVEVQFAVLIVEVE